MTCVYPHSKVLFRDDIFSYKARIRYLHLACTYYKVPTAPTSTYLPTPVVVVVIVVNRSNQNYIKLSSTYLGSLVGGKFGKSRIRSLALRKFIFLFLLAND